MEIDKDKLYAQLGEQERKEVDAALAAPVETPKIAVSEPKATESYSFNVTEEDRAVADSLEEDTKLNLAGKRKKLSENLKLRRNQPNDGVVEAGREK